MAASSCRVWGSAVGLGTLRFQARREQPEGCNGRIVSGSLGDCLRRRREGRLQTCRIASKNVAGPLISERRQLQWDELRIQSTLTCRDLSDCRSRRQHAFPKASNDFSSNVDGAGEDSNSDSAWAAFTVMPALVGFSGEANAMGLGDEYTPNLAYGEVGAVLEFGVQLIYLGALIALLGVGSFLVVRQVLIRRELESAAKELQDRVRSGEATSEEYFELGAVMLRKKFYVLANKHLEQAIKKWDGDEADLAQVYNALGFSYFSDGKLDGAITQYEKAVKLQPGYVTAWNNLGDAYEKKKDFQRALKAYEEALQFDPSNKIARRQRDAVKERVDRFQGIPSNE